MWKLLGFFLFFLFSCDDFSFYTQLDGEEGLRILAEGGVLTDILTIIPENAVLPTSTSITFTATGGTSPYSFSISSGVGSIDGETGVYSAPSSAGEAVVAVADGNGFEREASVTVVAVGEFTISPVSITLYTYNTLTFSAIGGVAPFVYSLVSGNGIVDMQSGFYTAPSAPGTDTVRVTDSLGNKSDAVITILAPFSLSPPTLQITVNNLYTFTAAGGKPPYTFDIVSGTGTIDPDTGEFTAPGAADTTVISASDTAGNYGTSTVTVIPAGALLISPTSITLNVNGTVTFSATGGTAPYEFTIHSGTGIVGLTTGAYTAPAAPGTDIVRLTDDDGSTSDAVVSVVSSGPLAINPSSVVMEQYDIYFFYPDGGTPPYIFSVTSGSGIINPSSGVYTAPAAIGNETVRVTDSLSAWAEAAVEVTPAAPTNLVADGTVSGNDTITLTWDDNAAGESGYRIERKVGSGGAFVFLSNVPADSTTYPDTGLSPNTVYGYRVRAYNGAVVSEWSNVSADIPNA